MTIRSNFRTKHIHFLELQDILRGSDITEGDITDVRVYIGA